MKLPTSLLPPAIYTLSPGTKIVSPWGIRNCFCRTIAAKRTEFRSPESVGISFTRVPASREEGLTRNTSMTASGFENRIFSTSIRFRRTLRILPTHSSEGETHFQIPNLSGVTPSSSEKRSGELKRQTVFSTPIFEASWQQRIFAASSPLTASRASAVLIPASFRVLMLMQLPSTTLISRLSLICSSISASESMIVTS